MTDRFKNKCFNKDATSDLQQALHWNILKKKKYVCVGLLISTTITVVL